MILTDFFLYVLIIFGLGEGASVLPKNTLLRNKRISNGNVDYESRFPFMVRIHSELISSQGIEFRVSCGASLISKEYVLTAAHCLPVNLIYIKVILGANDTSKISEPQRVEMKVPKENFIIHEEFESSPRENDIGLIKLPQEINITRFIKPVRLPNRAFANLDSVMSVIIGWGSTGPEGDDADFVRYATQTILPNEYCAEIYKKFFHSSNICIHGSPSNTCSGDSGGPAVVLDDDGHFVIVGVASTQYKCGSGYPSSYARVTSYLDWIHNNTGIKISD